MPPKYKFQKDEIILAALELVRNAGPDGLTARALAQQLGSSSKVIFGLFTNMEELHQAVHKKAYELYLASLQQEIQRGKYPPYKSMGIAYIRFAIEEKELFKLLFMREQKEQTKTTPPDFELSVQKIQEANGLSGEEATLMHLESWVCVHGIATMHATSFLTLDEELISKILTDTYQGLRHRHLTREE